MDANLQYLTFNEVGVTLAAIAAACGFIALVWNAIKAMKEWIASIRKPTDDRIDADEDRIEDHEKRITYLEGCCEEVHGKLNADWEFQQEEREMNRLVLKSIKQLLKHSIDGNDTEGLVDMEGRIDAFLIDHAK